MVSRPLHPLVGAISHRFARGTNDAAPSTAADWHIASRPVRIGKQAGVSLVPVHKRLFFRVLEVFCSLKRSLFARRDGTGLA
ncbi:hypothetical protein CN203_22475, partial [Sinorhizobium meliloti]